MFKKPFVLSCQNLLGNKDRKKLKLTVLKELPHCSDDNFEELVPAKEELTLAKVSGARIALYICKDQPIFFEANCAIYPTVYALWQIPTLLPSFVTHAPVSKFVLNGADLMLPGVIPPVGGFQEALEKGQRWSIRVVNNRFPFAVGSCQTTNSHIGQQGMKGKALEVVHYFTDFLWQLGSKSIPNDSFTAKLISGSNFKDESYNAVAHLHASADVGDAWGAENNNQTIAEDEVEKETPISCEDEAKSDIKSVEVAMESLTVNDAEEDQRKIPQLALTAEQMDEYLHFCLLDVLRLSVTDDQLPLDSSAVYSKMVAEGPNVTRNPLFIKKLQDLGCDLEQLVSLRVGEAEVAVDIKKSSHKKLTKFMQSHVKQKIIQTKEVRGSVSIVKVNREHPMYMEYVPLPEKARRTVVNVSQPKAADDLNSTTPGIQVLEFYMPPQNCLPFFKALNIRTGKDCFFNITECRDAMTKYITDVLPQNVVMSDEQKGNKSIVVLDAVLATMLLSKGEKDVETLSKAEMFQRFEKQMQPCYAVMKAGIDLKVEPPKVIKGVCPPVRISVEDRSGGRKHTTHIIGLGTFGVDAAAVAEFLQKKLYCSATTYDLPGKVKDVAVMLQGSMATQCVDALNQHFKIPRKYIEIEQKKPAKK